MAKSRLFQPAPAPPGKAEGVEEREEEMSLDLALFLALPPLVLLWFLVRQIRCFIANKRALRRGK